MGAERGDVHAAVLGLVPLEPAQCLLELPCRRDRPSAAGLIPGDRDVDESLEEVLLLRRRRSPGRLQLFVRLEVAPGADVLEPVLVRVEHRL